MAVDQALYHLACTAAVLLAAQHVWLFLARPRQYAKLWDPRLDAVTLYDSKRRMSLATKAYLFFSWLGLSLATAMMLNQLVSWLVKDFSLLDQTGPVGVASGIGSFALVYAMDMSARAHVEAEKRAEQMERFASRLEQESNERIRSFHNDKAELDRLRQQSSADTKTIDKLNLTIADLQKQIPVTIRFEG